jgi:uncharacterized repeat protein (TIGR03803 family)
MHAYRTHAVCAASAFFALFVAVVLFTAAASPLSAQADVAAMVAGTAPAPASVTFRVIYNNQGYNQPSRLIEGSPGVFYSIAGSGPSVAFSVTTQGSRTILANFPGGVFQSLLVSAPNGRFYSSIYSGTTSVFSVTSAPNSLRTYSARTFDPLLIQSLPDGTLLSVGTGGADGLWHLIRCDLHGNVTSIATVPSGERLENAMFASDGNYYGIAQALLGSNSYVFRATASGTLTTIYTFPAGTFTSGFRATPLLEADDGNFYGSTATGGANGTGMIYKLTPAGQFTLLHSFEKGKYPSGPTTLIEASDGNLYGDALAPDLAGQIFRITKSGQYTLLHQMTGPGAGGCPCWLVQGSDGIVYGMAHTGGTSGDGLVFALDPGLPIPKPRAQSFSPQSGAASTKVRIWGHNLLSAAVQFNGVPAAAVSNSGPNYVWAKVPAGATTGPITVTTPGGTDTTQASFAVQ